MDQIKSAYKEFLADPTKVNNLLQIHEAITVEGVDLVLYQKGIQAILGILKKCISEGLLFEHKKKDKEGSANVAAAVTALKEWLKGFFWSFLEETLLSRLEDAAWLTCHLRRLWR